MVAGGVFVWWVALAPHLVLVSAGNPLAQLLLQSPMLRVRPHLWSATARVPGPLGPALDILAAGRQAPAPAAVAAAGASSAAPLPAAAAAGCGASQRAGRPPWCMAHAVSAHRAGSAMAACGEGEDVLMSPLSLSLAHALLGSATVAPPSPPHRPFQDPQACLPFSATFYHWRWQGRWLQQASSLSWAAVMGHCV